jgi:hypothetical protein
MGSSAIDEWERRTGRRITGLCQWHAFETGIGKRPTTGLCGARCSGKRRPWIRGKPCEQPVVKGRKRCRHHGAFNGGKRTPKWTAAEKEARARAKSELSDWLIEQAKLKAARPRPIQWSPDPPQILEEQFRPARKPRGWSPY